MAVVTGGVCVLWFRKSKSDDRNSTNSLVSILSLTPASSSPTPSCQNPKPLESRAPPGKPSAGRGGSTFCEFPCAEPGASPALQLELLCQVWGCQNKAGAVFLDGTTWLQVVRSQNSYKILRKKKRPLLSRSGEITNVGEAKIKKLKLYFAKSSEMFPRSASRALKQWEGFFYFIFWICRLSTQSCSDLHDVSQTETLDDFTAEINIFKNVCSELCNFILNRRPFRVSEVLQREEKAGVLFSWGTSKTLQVTAVCAPLKAKHQKNHRTSISRQRLELGWWRMNISRQTWWHHSQVEYHRENYTCYVLMEGLRTFTKPTQRTDIKVPVAHTRLPLAL